jgi:hypothetical protein
VGPADHSAKLGGGVRSTFSREQWICPTLLGQCERLPCTEAARRKCTLGVCELVWKAYVACLSGFPLQGVHRFKSS